MVRKKRLAWIALVAALLLLAGHSALAAQADQAGSGFAAANGAHLGPVAADGLRLASAAVDGESLACAAARKARLEAVVSDIMRPLMAEHGIPGMAVGLTLRGERHFFYFGLASLADEQPVDEETLFEIGSVSKTFTAALAAWARERGALALEDKAAAHMPALAGSSFESISLLELGAYTAGGLPLQFPAEVRDAASMLAYCKKWRPAYAPGTRRLYSNPSIGLFGHLAALSLGRDFDRLLEEELFPALGLSHTHITVPKERMRHYAWGYNKDMRPVRVQAAVLASEAYGVKTTATDLIRFVEANIKADAGAGVGPGVGPGIGASAGANLAGGKGGNGNQAAADQEAAAPGQALSRALAATRGGYFAVAGGMIQGLGWEMYACPARLDALLAGNSPDMIFKANTATRLEPPWPPQEEALVNKTGSTNGFGAYAAFVPAKKLGLVILANRNYPAPARITAAYRILAEMEQLP